MIISEIKDKTMTGLHRKNPAFVVIKERYLLTKPHSTKQVYHISLDLTKTAVPFKVGDSIGVLPQNDPQDVEKMLNVLRANGKEEILDPRSNEPISIYQFLSSKANLNRLTSDFLKLHDKYAPLERKDCFYDFLLPENKPKLTHYLQTHEIHEFLQQRKETFPIPLQELCAQFSPLLPRFYSVASSPTWIREELHLTVAVTFYIHRNQPRYGVASRFLCHLAQENHTPIAIYVQKAPHFFLPEDKKTPIIMIGPGTGVAPFRAFLQERMHSQATGKNWLFFGERNRLFDYYYQEFWEDLVTRGLLKLSVAFSRDQEHKIYVQHMMQENSKELFAWLQEGAHVYVCGDAKRMAIDVDAMLHTIVQNEGAMTPEAAKHYIKSLKTQKRYLIDVY